MRGAFLAYMAATSSREGRPQQCCTDEPPASRELDARTPWWLARWTSKMARGLPTSARVLRRSFTFPVAARSAIGTAVVTREGKPVGRVADEVVTLDTGTVALAIELIAERDPAGVVVVLVPPDALLPTARGRVAVIDRDWDHLLVA
jgi:hypothetical protein